MSISFNTLPSDLRVPLFYAEMDNSRANTAQESRRALLLGHALPDAPIKTNTPVRMPTEALAQKLTGRGSQLHRMVTAYRRIDPLGELWVIAVPEPKPPGGPAWSCLGLVGRPQAPGVLSLWIGCRRLRVAVNPAQTLDEIAEHLTQAINTASDLPVTARLREDREILLTARHSGMTGRDIPLSTNPLSAGEETSPPGLALVVDRMRGDDYTPDVTAAIAAMGDTPFDFIGLPFHDSDTLALFEQEMNEQSGRWSPYRQLYGHVYTAKTGSLSELVALGESLNSPHLTVAGYEPAIQTCLDEGVAARLARSAVFLRADPARPTQTGELNGVLPAPVGKRFTLTEQQSLLSHGIATAYVEGGALRIQRDITTYKKNAAGVADNSYLDSETLHTSASVLRRLKSVITSRYGRHKLADDGTRFGAGQAIVTPSVIRAELCAVYRQLEREGMVENVEAFRAHLIVERHAHDPNRLDVLFPPDYVNALRVFAVINQFRLQYQENV
ncbi:phage tail sheath subtilisin-like domain-containing protein [Candidatus Hamiltonella endosymbiont of Tuberolachnus salignus]|uniref:phage tail sheath subtilisin-like domain-containing protein n=1 Tax=Candidatus Williamhamiltonella endosymbiont of Tuberolachnus salignus TaxID=3077954 RepID=UPI0030D579A1